MAPQQQQQPSTCNSRRKARVFCRVASHTWPPVFFTCSFSSKCLPLVETHVSHSGSGLKPSLGRNVGSSLSSRRAFLNLTILDHTWKSYEIHASGEDTSSYVVKPPKNLSQCTMLGRHTAVSCRPDGHGIRHEEEHEELVASLLHEIFHNCRIRQHTIRHVDWTELSKTAGNGKWPRCICHYSWFLSPQWSFSCFEEDYFEGQPYSPPPRTESSR